MQFSELRPAVPHRVLQRDWFLERLNRLMESFWAHPKYAGDLFELRRTAELLPESTRNAQDPMRRFRLVNRDADRTGLIRQGPGDALPDPPGRIRTELESFTI